MDPQKGEGYDAAAVLENGLAVLGFELGSTRIKSTLIGPDYRPLASGSFGWENRYENGVWTYDLRDVWSGIETCFSDLVEDVRRSYGVTLTSVAAAGFSAMMHGYLAIDGDGNPLVPFRTWRNNITEEAARELTNLFTFPIPQRWSIAHLYQAIKNGEEHVQDVAHITTLSGYVHRQLTGKFVIGIGDASGMFPIDPSTRNYNSDMVVVFNELIQRFDIPWKIEQLLPAIIPAGEQAGTLTEEGALLLDSRRKLQPGIPLCAPEGDAGTGMVATNSVKPRTGNVSAGTSVFAMLVLEKELSVVHPEIDLVLTPDGKPVAMAHSNNCTSDFDAWMSLFKEVAETMGLEVTISEIFDKIVPLALRGEADAGGLLSYGYLSGEHVTGFSQGRPLFVRSPDSTFTLANVVRSHLFSSLCALRTGLNILTEDEGVQVEEIRGHGGFFKTSEVGQTIMAAATNTPVSVLDTAGEGGAWGMALLAAFLVREKKERSLSEFLDYAFRGSVSRAVAPESEDVRGFERYFERYTEGLPIERAAVDHLTSR